MLQHIKKEILAGSSSKRAATLGRFFKTGKGEYGEGDRFLGLTVPQTRKIAQKYASLDLEHILGLLKSEYHEERLVGWLILVQQYEKGNSADKKKIFELYLNNLPLLNNWDFVDLTAPKIVGNYLLSYEDNGLLQKLARSDNLWERRVAIVSTYALIKTGRFKETLNIAEMLLKDTHDLIHKAVGWMLREVGKKDKRTLERFLKKNYAHMPRTALRYSIERFPEKERKNYLKGIFS